MTRFIENLKHLRRKLNPTNDELTVEEINNAEKIWLKAVQASISNFEKYDKLKNLLRLFEDNDRLLCCRGKLDDVPLPYESKFLVFLPSDHHFTKLIILRCHHEVLNNGVGETLTQLRTRYWVVIGRQGIKRMPSTCTLWK